MSEHEERARAVEREIDEMQQESDRLGTRIDDARDDWEARKSDEAVPGAGTADDAATAEATGEEETRGGADDGRGGGGGDGPGAGHDPRAAEELDD